MLRTRIPWRSSFFILMLVVFCSSLSSAKTTIRVAHAWESTFLHVQKSFDKDFMEKYPNINVKMENLDWNTLTDKLTTMAAAGTLPDVVYVHWSYAQNFIRRGIFQDLSAYIKNEKGWDYQDIFPTASTPFLWKGKIFGIPYDAGPVIPYYNKNILRNLGVNVPSSDWTFDEFLEICKKATRDNNGDGRIDQWGTERFFDDELFPGPIPKAFGGGYLSADEQSVILDRPESIEGLKWFADLSLKHKVVGAGESFTTGKAAFTFGGSWMMERYLNLKKFDSDVLHMPRGPKGQFATIYGSGYVISAASKHKKEAWTYLKEYLSKQGMDYMWGKSGRGSPARRSAWESFVKAWKGKNVVVFADAMKYSNYGQPLSPVSPRFREVVWREFNAMLAKKKSVEQAVSSIKKEGEPILHSMKLK